MNNEYENGLYGTHLKYFSTRAAYNNYKETHSDKKTPNVALLDLQPTRKVAYDWEAIEDMNLVVLTSSSNPLLWQIMYDENDLPYTGVDPEDSTKGGYTIGDLASLTINDLYSSKSLSDNSHASVFAWRDGMSDIELDYNDYSSQTENYNQFTFNEFKYFLGITEIPPYFFNNCFLLTQIELPEGVCKLGKKAFHDCHNLNKLVINASELDVLANSPENIGINMALAYAGKNITGGDDAEYDTTLSSCIQYLKNDGILIFNK